MIFCEKSCFRAAYFDTPLGRMVAISDERALYFLEFEDCCEFSLPQFGRSDPIDAIEAELDQYFEGRFFGFKTPIVSRGSIFQNRVWEEVKKIPFGETRSYFQIADAIGSSFAYRAVARSCSFNRLLIVVPCHRVINKSGKEGGYKGDVVRKKWLLEHESLATTPKRGCISREHKNGI